MNTSSHMLKLAPRRGASVVFLMAALAAASAHAAFNSGSTGADGALNPTVSTEIQLPESGVLNYTTVNIPVGVTVKFKKNTANTPVVILASGDVTIAGGIDIRGTDAASTGTDGNGVLGDDGIPGVGGPGGYDGGRGGRDDVQLRPTIIRGGTGLGPGGGAGGTEGGDGCNNRGHFPYLGTGGGYASAAYQYMSRYYCSSTVTVFGKAYGSVLLQPLIGGSGGGGGRGGSAFAGSGGGGGGGAILIASSGTLRVTGAINARGGDGGGIAGTNAGGRGAGGSGGAIRLVATTVTGNGGLYAEGGCINANNQPRQYCGSSGTAWQNEYGGSPGRIRLEGEAVTFTGTSSPAYNAGQPGPVFIADAPSLRIATVDGQAVPTNPTGNADITLPASTTGPVEVTFQTTNVPTGNTVLLRLVPAYGQPTEVLSPAIAGTSSAGTASVSVTLPQGPSTLQATTTYTVVVAGTLDLSRFAQNEPVEKVEVTVAMVGEPSARVLTASGKAYEVSYTALRAAGFGG